MIPRPPKSTRTDTLIPSTTLYRSMPALTRLVLAAQRKFFASLGFFAIDPGSIPTDGLSYLAEQLGVEAGEIAGYDLSSRTARRHCAEILIHLGYHRMKRVDRAQLTEWIAGELCPGGQSINAMLEHVFLWCRDRRIYGPSRKRSEERSVGKECGSSCRIRVG